jgi:DNA-binding NtrC family response regulator
MAIPVAPPATVTVGAGIAVPAGVGAVDSPAPIAFVPAEPEPVEADDTEPPAGNETGGSLAAVAKAAAMKAERAAIEQTLRHVHWNRRKAAQILGVSYKTLLNKIKECGITRD